MALRKAFKVFRSHVSDAATVNVTIGNKLRLDKIFEPASGEIVKLVIVSEARHVLTNRAGLLARRNPLQFLRVVKPYQSAIASAVGFDAEDEAAAKSSAPATGAKPSDGSALDVRRRGPSASFWKAPSATLTPLLPLLL